MSDEKINKIVNSNEAIQDLLMNLMDRVEGIQQTNIIVRELLGDLYDKYGNITERFHIIEKAQPPEIQEKIEEQKDRFEFHPINFFKRIFKKKNEEIKESGKWI